MLPFFTWLRFFGGMPTNRRGEERTGAHGATGRGVQAARGRVEMSSVCAPGEAPATQKVWRDASVRGRGLEEGCWGGGHWETGAAPRRPRCRAVGALRTRGAAPRVRGERVLRRLRKFGKSDVHLQPSDVAVSKLGLAHTDPPCQCTSATAVRCICSSGQNLFWCVQLVKLACVVPLTICSPRLYMSTSLLTTRVRLALSLTAIGVYST